MHICKTSNISLKNILIYLWERCFLNVADGTNLGAVIVENGIVENIATWKYSQDMTKFSPKVNLTKYGKILSFREFGPDNSKLSNTACFQL